MIPRFSEEFLAESLAYAPVVLVHGPRQCGKSTFARMLGDRMGYDYISFDTDVMRDAALNDPLGFVDDLPQHVILDEVQRVQELFTTLKLAVDQDRKPGRFLLTGSANVLLLPRLSDSLAGRMAILRLHPFAQCEIGGQPSNFLDKLFNSDFGMHKAPRLKDELLHRIVTGGYPPALVRTEDKRRDLWFRDYVTTLVQRDVSDIANIKSLDALPRLLQLAASRTAQLWNEHYLAREAQLSLSTIAKYMRVFEKLFLFDKLHPWFSYCYNGHNRTNWLLITPKLHTGDTGLACSLLGLTVQTLKQERGQLGPLLETFVYQELRRMASWHDRRHDFYHYRDKDKVEVDIVIERSILELVGVEVKASATVTAADFKGLNKLKELAGDRFKCGVVLYDGETSVRFGEKLYAVPLRFLWESV